jgi:hypothetical protein
MRRCLAVFLTSWMKGNLQRSLLHIHVCIFRLNNFTISHDNSHAFFALIHQEVEEILELLKSTWRILGITETVHDTCYAWVLFRQVNYDEDVSIKATFVEIVSPPPPNVLDLNIFTREINYFFISMSVNCSMNSA